MILVVPYAQWATTQGAVDRGERNIPAERLFWVRQGSVSTLVDDNPVDANRVGVVEAKLDQQPMAVSATKRKIDEQINGCKFSRANASR